MLGNHKMVYKNVFYKGSVRIPNIKGQGAAREVAHSELAGHQNKGNFFVMAATKQYRYVYDKQNNLACELFDLEKDPDEFHKDYVQPQA